MAELRTSAVALLDALGFKGIEKRVSSTDAAAALTTARTTLASAANYAGERGKLHIDKFGGPAITKVAWFSDTIYLVVQAPDYPWGAPPSTVEIESRLLDIVAFCTGYMLRAAAQAEPPLTFRGVVTIGKALVEGNDIFFGEAIEEASSLYECAEGAFVWLSPEAASKPMVWRGTAPDSLVPYAVPLKGGGSIETKVVNPFTDMVPTAEPGTNVRAGIERAMTVDPDRFDVAVKRQNTLRFLDDVARKFRPAVQREHGDETPEPD